MGRVTRSYSFPEDAYPPLARFSGEYRQRVERGAKVAAECGVAVCGLARDLGTHLPHALAGIDAIGRLFSRSWLCIFENDSVDGTRDRLIAWAAEDDARHRLVSKFTGNPKWEPVRSGLRGEHMASYRNGYQDVVRDLAGLDGPDYVVVVDTDLEGWSLEGILSTLGHEHWDMMGAHGLATVRGRVVQYDAWAWRDVGHPTPHTAIEVNPRIYDRGHPPVPVLSCFGGMAVYRIEAFLSSRYAGGDCEHVPFHIGMAEAGFDRSFLNPGMVALYRG